MPNYELQGYGRESVYIAAQGIKISLEKIIKIKNNIFMLQISF